ncbi:MAG: FtsX-like permease family protein [Parachlamydiaceae bacterium]
MFELSIALKYLIPRWRQLSVSIISIISTLVIALVVWLIVVFFSVKDGLENGWVEKIVALTAPVRLSPTDNYYQSYYYLSDSISSRSDYTNKSIREKLNAAQTDPYNPSSDEETPSAWPHPDTNEQGRVKDLVKLAFGAAQHLISAPNGAVSDYETTVVYLLLPPKHTVTTSASPQFSEYALLLGTFDANTPAITKAFIPPTALDFDKASIPFQDIAHVLAENQGIVLPPSSQLLGDPVLLPRGFKEHGTVIGDRGYITYYSPTVSSVQEQRMPVYISGFYDPGIIPIGGKLMLANHDLVSMIRSSSAQENSQFSNGINVRFDQLTDASKVKNELEKALQDAGIAQYWQVSTYQEYEFTKDIIQQLQSEKNLFSLISLVIIVVACSNIISMLIILVNDKKLEIGILRSMGTTSTSIAIIFGFCGMVMGTVGSLLGIIAAILTLRYVNELVGMISRLQGHDLFNPVFYGHTLPSSLSMEALTLVVITTAFISLLAGIVPAMKASMMRPSTILRAE